MSSGSHFRMRLLTSVMIFVNRCCIWSGELFGDHPRASDEGIRKCGFSMIDVCRGADVADAVLQVKEGLGFLDVLFFSSHRRDTYGGIPVSEVAPDRD